MLTATWMQIATYLLIVCPGSIAVLVFINSTSSFVVTDLIGQTRGVGNAIGTLGFADELLALLACPLWGVLSDRVGSRFVCVTGYVILGFALIIFVQAKNIFPQLLLARLLFSVGGAACSTMVTAILPTMVRPPQEKPTVVTSSDNGHTFSPSISSEITITPQRIQNEVSPRLKKNGSQLSPTRLAGFVGMFTGCGALIALTLFLRLPEIFQRLGMKPGQALAGSYYIVGAFAFVAAILCFIGLRNLRGEEAKGWRALVHDRFSKRSNDRKEWLLLQSVKLGFKDPLVGLGYVGGFVARASSVGISLFIPLFVNSYYISSGLCDQSGDNPGDIKEHCRSAYVLAAELTGVSQLVALLFAPVFGYFAERYRRFNIPLLLAALVGVVGYIALAALKSPMTEGENGTLWIFPVMALLGISQIGAIVCSLGLLGRGVLEMDSETYRASGEDSSDRAQSDIRNSATRDPASSLEGNDRRAALTEDQAGGDESAPLLRDGKEKFSREHLKGSIAGVYSLAGGLGILILTKVGGLLFDGLSPVAPFYMLSMFNAMLLLAGIGSCVSKIVKRA